MYQNVLLIQKNTRQFIYQRKTFEKEMGIREFMATYFSQNIFATGAR